MLFQVLRYHQNGEPLWVSDEGKPSEGDIPLCECGSERVFEFQVIINKKVVFDNFVDVCSKTCMHVVLQLYYH